MQRRLQAGEEWAHFVNPFRARAIQHRGMGLSRLGWQKVEVQICAERADKTIPACLAGGQLRTMVLQLPTYEQVVFEDSPLEGVLCQLRFSDILKIATTPPADFQDCIRKKFPEFAEERGVEFGLGSTQPFIMRPQGPAWQFKTADGRWLVSLTSTFITLRTTAYHDFQEFLEWLAPVVQAFERVYEVPFYSRVGLRYVNRFVVPRVGGRRVEWHKFLNTHVAGAFADPVLCDGIVEAKNYLVLEGEHGRIAWRYSRDVGETDGRPAERYTLDFDHYAAGEVACADVRQKLLGFNDTLYRLFRWCLTAEGYASLQPRPKPGNGGTA